MPKISDTLAITLQRQDWAQEPHCCAPLDAEPRLTLERHDGGGGPYIVLTAVEWALDDCQGIQALMDLLIAFLPDEADPTAKKESSHE